MGPRPADVDREPVQLENLGEVQRIQGVAHELTQDLLFAGRSGVLALESHDGVGCILQRVERQRAGAGAPIGTPRRRIEPADGLSAVQHGSIAVYVGDDRYRREREALASVSPSAEMSGAWDGGPGCCGGGWPTTARLWSPTVLTDRSLTGPTTRGPHAWEDLGIVVRDDRLDDGPTRGGPTPAQYVLLLVMTAALTSRDRIFHERVRRSPTDSVSKPVERDLTMDTTAIREELVDHLDALGHDWERTHGAAGQPGVLVEQSGGTPMLEVYVTDGGALVDADGVTVRFAGVPSTAAGSGERRLPERFDVGAVDGVDGEDRRPDADLQ
jgi:hypothetical protein